MSHQLGRGSFVDPLVPAELPSISGGGVPALHMRLFINELLIFETLPHPEALTFSWQSKKSGLHCQCAVCASRVPFHVGSSTASTTTLSRCIQKDVVRWI